MELAYVLTKNGAQQQLFYTRPDSAVSQVNNGARATTISERRWAMVDHAGVATSGLCHPLTIDGEDIGSFDLMRSCGMDTESFDVSYIERLRGGDHVAVPGRLSTITLRFGAKRASLNMMSSERRKNLGELVTYVVGPVQNRRPSGGAVITSAPNLAYAWTQSGRPPPQRHRR